jgi:SAM-dependent methyltransferase
MDNFYDCLARHYDTMQSDMDVRAWAEYYASLIERHSKIKVRTITDLGCGTGSVDIPLAKMGYKVTGIDSAGQMLTLASARRGAGKIIWSLQDITDFELPFKTDCFISVLDTVDHITDENAIRKMFANIADYLNAGGVFVFDAITRKHLAKTLADNVFYEDYEDFTLLWLNSYDADTRTNTAELTLFEKQADGRFVRYDGDLVERFYPEKFFVQTAKKAGLVHLGTYDELSDNAPDKDSERIFLVFGKPSEENG